MSAPKAPDPVKTANAQADMNRSTAVTQYMLGATDQYTPDGSLTYQQTGTQSYVDDKGKVVNVPKYTATQTLSAGQQKLYDQQQALGQGMNNLAIGQVGRLQDVMSKPVDLSNAATEARLMELGRSRLDPLLDQRRQTREADLINRGIRPGTEAYDRAMGAVGQQENDAYNSLLLGGRQQAVTEALAERNQPINEISALMGGGQVSMPQFTNTPQPGVNGVDYTGLVNQKYQADVANHQAMMGGMFGLGSTLLGGWGNNGFKFSDRRLKSGVRRVGTHRLGIGVYEYTIGGERQRGVMADEVRGVMPEAVRTVGGFDQVNYSMLGDL